MTPWTLAHQAPLSMGFSSQNTGVGCQFLLQGIFLTQVKPRSPKLQADYLPSEPPGKYITINQVYVIIIPISQVEELSLVEVKPLDQCHTKTLGWIIFLLWASVSLFCEVSEWISLNYFQQQDSHLKSRHRNSIYKTAELHCFKLACRVFCPIPWVSALLSALWLQTTQVNGF